jgi:hypothetical protein
MPPRRGEGMTDTLRVGVSTTRALALEEVATTAQTQARPASRFFAEPQPAIHRGGRQRPPASSRSLTPPSTERARNPPNNRNNGNQVVDTALLLRNDDRAVAGRPRRTGRFGFAGGTSCGHGKWALAAAGGLARGLPGRCVASTWRSSARLGKHHPRAGGHARSLELRVEVIEQQLSARVCRSSRPAHLPASPIWDGTGRPVCSSRLATAATPRCRPAVRASTGS